MSKKIFLTLIFTFTALIPVLNGMEAESSSPQQNSIANNHQESWKDDTLITVELIDANHQTTFLINLPYKAIKLSTTLHDSLAFETQSTIIPIVVNQTETFRAFQQVLQLLEMLVSEGLEETYISHFFTKKSIFKLLNVAHYLDCSQLHMILVKALCLKIKNLIFEKNKLPKAIKFIQKIKDPYLRKELFDLVTSSLKNKNKIKYQFIQSHTLDEHNDMVLCLTISHNGEFLASGSLDKTILIWDIERGIPVDVISESSSINSIFFSADDSMIFYLTNDAIKTLDLASKSIINALPCFTLHNTITLSPDGTKFSMIPLDPVNQIMLFDTATNNILHILDSHNEAVNFSTFSHDSSKIASSSKDQTTKIWDLATGTPTHTINEYSTFIEFSPNNENIAIITGDGIKIFNLTNDLYLQDIENQAEPFSSVKFSMDGTLLASVSFTSKTIKIWDIKTGKCLQTLKDSNTKFIDSLYFSPDGTKLIFCSINNEIHLYSTRNLEDQFTLPALLFLDYVLTLETGEKLPSEELYFDLYYALPAIFQEMIFEFFDTEELNSYLEQKKS